MSRTIATDFDPHRNALNAIRLVLALLVVVWHAMIMTGHRLAEGPGLQVVADLSVDAFFAISGFLITQSWVRDPSLLRFLRARAARLLPAFWASLITTAFVVAPLALLIGPGALPSGYWPDALAYVFRNAGLWIRQYDIAGSPWAGGQWNSPMWTLWWEAFCYFAVVVLGLAGLLRFRSVTVGLFVASVLATGVHVFVQPIPVPYVENALRFGLMFLAGQLVFQLGERLPVNRSMVIAGLALYLGSLWLPDYRILGGLPLAYLVIALGAQRCARRLQFRHDLSYGTYIFTHPMQIALDLFGLTSLGVVGFSALSVAVGLPVAALSWFLVERPVLARVRRLRAVRAPMARPS